MAPPYHSQTQPRLVGASLEPRMAYRLYDPNPAYVNLLGTGTVPGGSLTFYDRGTTTEKNTYSDEEMGVGTENENPLPLDASGRAETEVWLDGEYTVVLKDVGGTPVWTRDVIPEVAPTTNLPDPATNPGGTVKSNGTGYALETVVSLPDTTDSEGYMLVVSGGSPTWVPQPEPEEANVTVTTNRIVFVSGDGTRAWQVLKGSATIPHSNATSASLPVTYPNPFKSGEVPHVAITPAPGTQPGGPVVPFLDGLPTSTNFTAKVDVAEGNSINANVTVDVVFQWRAEGEIDPP